MKTEISRREFIKSAFRLSTAPLLAPPFLFALGDVNYLSRGSDIRMSRIKPAMGTLLAISAVHERRDGVSRALKGAFTEVKRLESKFTVFDANSEISRINASAGEREVSASPEVLQLLRRALELSESTGGAVSPVMLPLMRAWGFYGESTALPNSGIVQSALKLVSESTLNLDFLNLTAALDEDGAGIDLGGMAKGAVLDEAASSLKSAGVTSALLNAGGDLVAFGKPQEGEEWEIIVRNPLQPDVACASVFIEEGAVATSGGYFNYREVDGRRIPHLIDPRSGSPGSDLLSVTVAASGCFYADALSTALFVMGRKEAIRFAESSNDVKTLLIWRGNHGTLEFHSTGELNFKQYDMRN